MNLWKKHGLDLVPDKYNLLKNMEYLTNHKMYIVSNSYELIIELILKKHKIRERFDTISGFSIKSPKSIRLKELIKNHKNSIVISDDIQDIDTAIENGQKVIYLGNEALIKTKAKKIDKDYSEVVRYIKTMTSK